jgi:hypothetical protein
MSEWLFHIATRAPWEPGPALHIGQKAHNGGLAVLRRFEFGHIAEHEHGGAPVLAGADAEAFLRAAMNAAWELGLRPDGYLDTRESMTATNAHLQDMRALAFHKLGATKP